MNTKKTLTCLWLLVSLFSNMVPAVAQQAEAVNAITQNPGDSNANFKDLLRQTRGPEYATLLEKMFGSDAEGAAAVFDEGSVELLQAVTSGTIEKAEESLENQISQRKEKTKQSPVVDPNAKPGPARKPARKAATRSKKLGFHLPPQTNWRQFAFGFAPFQDGTPNIKMTETDKEIRAEGTDKKSFETKDAKGTRTQKAETKYTKDGKTFGMEIKNSQVIEAVSKPDGKSFRQEISMVWGAEVTACPDVNGVSAGTGKAHVISKTIYTENGATFTMSSEFDIRAKLSGQVDDQAKIHQYDMEIETTTTNTGYENALKQGLIKEIKLRDGSYELDFDIPSNTLEISDGTYGGSRTPAKIGETVGRKITPMPEADAKTLGSAVGPMIPSIWNSANEMYKTAERSWRNYGCVEVVIKAPKTALKQGEEIAITAETVHLQDKTKVNAQLEGGGYPAQVTPETQNGTPSATFTFTNEADKDKTTFYAKSVSKRGIGEGEVEFKVEGEEEESAPGAWTGTIRAERKQREEREKRSGANLAENGGHMETTTNVQLQLTGQLDRTVDATNAYIANVGGTQEVVDFEYDKYKLDEGYCGPNAVPYKGPKEIARTSTTTVNYTRETRVYLEIGGSSGSATFSLPEQNGTTIHKYVHKSPCAEHDRANTSEATNEDAPTPGGSFSFSFPIDPAQKTIKGSITIQEEDGSTTTYSWDMSRR